MIPEATIQAVKEIPIVDYLASLGHTHVQCLGPHLLYYSPFTEERTPSCFVHPRKNVFNDFATGRRGDIIRLVRELHHYPFPIAVEHLERFNGRASSVSIMPEVIKLLASPDNRIQLTQVAPLNSKALLSYSVGRGISPKIIRRYCAQVYYRFGENENQYYAIGWKTDEGGYELRNKVFKGSITPKSITTLSRPGYKRVNVFEGFMNFLSALMYYRITEPTCTTIVLNSVGLIAGALPLLSQYEQVHVYFDRGKGGRGALEIVQDVHPKVFDQSVLYADYDDFNDFLCKRSIQKASP